MLSICSAMHCAPPWLRDGVPSVVSCLPRALAHAAVRSGGRQPTFCETGGQLIDGRAGGPGEPFGVDIVVLNALD